MTPVKQLLYDLVNTLTDLEIEYALMGGWCVRAYGVPRPTYDVDVTIVLPEERRADLFEAVEKLGYEFDNIYKSGWTDDVAGMPLVKAKTFVDGRTLVADIFICTNVFQQSAMQRRERADVNGIRAWIISPEDLVLMKLVANRHRDLGDVQDVFLMLGTLDESYMRTWAAKLRISDRLEQALHEAKTNDR